MKKLNKIQFANINPYIDNNVKLPVENTRRNSKWVLWGDDNQFPSYLYELFLEVPSLKAIIESVSNYVLGNEQRTDFDFTKVTTNITMVGMDSLLKAMCYSYCIYGGILLEIHRNVVGKITNLYVMDFKNVRINADKSTFYYSSDFSNKSYVNKSRVIELPKYDSSKNDSISVLYYSIDTFTQNVYPTPIYSGAIKSCEIERSIDNFHLNSIKNGFVSSAIFNMNNGIPEPEDQEEISNAIEEKFSGDANAGRIMVSFNEDSDHQMSVETLSPTDFSDQYTNLASRCRQQIFMSWRTTPNLIGVPTETTGFNSQEYSSAYKLFSKNTIEPIQAILCKLLKQLGLTVSITPYKLDLEEE